MKVKIWISILWIGVLLSCTKEKQQINKYVLGEIPAEGYFPGKSNLKTDLQFISIAYSDLFGEQISGTRLNRLMDGYNSLGDKQIIIDRILRNLLKDPAVLIPTSEDMRGNIGNFTRDTYRRFLVRQPNESEFALMTKMIQTQTDLTPADIYYAFMTSEEYKYY